MDRLRTPDLENIVEVELWRWRYINESLFRLASFRDRYIRVSYDEIERDPEGATRRLYEFAGLAVSASLEDSVRNMQNTLFAQIHKNELDPAMCKKTTDRVLEDSPLREIL